MSINIAMWSGPRNISTALMRAFENRCDTIVWDEPLYAHYLARTGLDHPGSKEIITSGETDWRVVASKCASALQGRERVFYQKHMSHHIHADMELDWVTGLTCCFLIRHPHSVVASYTKTRTDPRLMDLGFVQQLRLFEHVCATSSIAPPVISAEDVLKDPPDMLQQLCDVIGIAYDENMLSWPAGPRSTDGVWAKHWYDQVIHSTGFKPWAPPRVKLTQTQRSLADACMPYYHALLKHRIKPTTIRDQS